MKTNRKGGWLQARDDFQIILEFLTFSRIFSSFYIFQNLQTGLFLEHRSLGANVIRLGQKVVDMCERVFSKSANFLAKVIFEQEVSLPPRLITRQPNSRSHKISPKVGAGKRNCAHHNYKNNKYKIHYWIITQTYCKLNKQTNPKNTIKFRII